MTTKQCVLTLLLIPILLACDGWFEFPSPVVSYLEEELNIEEHPNRHVCFRGAAKVHTKDSWIGPVHCWRAQDVDTGKPAYKTFTVQWLKTAAGDWNWVVHDDN